MFNELDNLQEIDIPIFTEIVPNDTNKFSTSQKVLVTKLGNIVYIEFVTKLVVSGGEFTYSLSDFEFTGYNLKNFIMATGTPTSYGKTEIASVWLVNRNMLRAGISSPSPDARGVRISLIASW